MKKRALAALLCAMLISTLVACDMELGGLVGELLGNSDLTGPGDDVQEPPYIEDSWIEIPGDGTYVDMPSDLPTGIYANHSLTVLGVSYDDLGQYTQSALASAASYERNLAVEKLYGISVECVQRIEQEIISAVKNDLNADLGEIDVVMANIAYTGTNLAQIGAIYNLNELEYLDLKASCWDTGVIEDLAFGDYAPMATGEILPGSDLMTALIAFNPEIAAQNGVDLYDYVQTGGWTLEKMYAIAGDCFRDLNGNGKSDQEDALGLLLESEGADALAVATGVTIVKKLEDNRPYANKKVTEDMSYAYKIIQKMVKDKATVYYPMTDPGMGGPAPAAWIFEMGNTLLYATTVQQAFDMSQSGIQVGILPYPKLNVEQEGYASYVSCNSTAVMVPKSASDLSFVGYSLQALAEASSFRSVLSAKTCQTPQDQEMLNMIIESKTPDFGASYVVSSLPFYIKKALEIDTDNLEKIVEESGLKIASAIRNIESNLS